MLLLCNTGTFAKFKASQVTLPIFYLGLPLCRFAFLTESSSLCFSWKAPIIHMFYVYSTPWRLTQLFWCHGFCQSDHLAKNRTPVQRMVKWNKILHGLHNRILVRKRVSFPTLSSTSSFIPSLGFGPGSGATNTDKTQALVSRYMLSPTAVDPHKQKQSHI